MSVQTFDFSQRWNTTLLVDSFVMPSTLPLVLPGLGLKRRHNDLIDLARALYIVDRFLPRHRDAERTDARDIHLILPVRVPERWNQPELNELLHRTLEFLTQDRWHLEFVARSLPAKSHSNTQVLLLPADYAVDQLEFGLYSGGADSSMGTLLNGLRHQNKTQVLIAATGSNLQKYQRASSNHMSKVLQSQGAQRLVDVTFETTVKHAAVRQLRQIEANKRLREESSQRTRGFLFTAIGAVVAASSGGTTLNVYENGVGAINLPYSRASVGADHTRSMHPRFLVLMSELLSALFDHPFRIHNPFWFTTKGQMATQVAQAGLDAVLKTTVSCEQTIGRGIGPMPLSGRRETHCGICTSCLLRQVSLRAAGVEDAKYTHALETLQGDDRRWLTLMEYQAQQLGNAASTDGNALVSLLKFSPDLRYAFDGLRLQGYSPAQVSVGLVDLFRMYASEWRRAQSQNASFTA